MGYSNVSSELSINEDSESIESSLFQDGYFEEKGIRIFKNFPNWQKQYKSLSSEWEIAFLLGLISDYKFANGEKTKNVLEIGVYNGVTSLYLLKTGLHYFSKFELYGIDIGEKEFFGGAVLQETNLEEQKHYHLYRGHTSFDIEKVIPNTIKIDLVFIDAAHSHPYPLFDLIHVIPFLNDDSICLLHDVVSYMRPNAWGESFIFLGWESKKYHTVQIEYVDKNKPVFRRTSLGCIKISKNKKRLYDNIRKIAQIPFRASPWKFGNDNLGITIEMIENLKQFMLKYYNSDFSLEIYKILKLNLEDYKRKWILYCHETNFYNYLFENILSQNKVIAELQQSINYMSKKPESLQKEINAEAIVGLSVFDSHDKKYDEELKYWIGRYNAENHSFENGFYKKIMLGMAQELDDSFLKNKIVVDFGCGPRGSLAWTQAPKLRIGVDVLIDRYFDCFGKEMYDNYLYIKSTEKYIPIPSEFADVVYTMNSMDHTNNFEVILNELFRILKPGGELIGSFNMNEPATPCEPQSLTYELLRELLFPKLKIQHKLTAFNGAKLKPPRGTYDCFFDQSMSQPSETDLSILWFRGKKK